MGPLYWDILNPKKRRYISHNIILTYYDYLNPFPNENLP